MRKNQLCGRAEAKRERRKAGEWRSEAPRCFQRSERGKRGKEEEESRGEKSGKEGEKLPGHGALCCSPHLSLPG